MHLAPVWVCCYGGGVGSSQAGPELAASVASQGTLGSVTDPGLRTEAESGEGDSQCPPPAPHTYG